MTFAVIAFYTRILSPDQFGIYTYVLAIVVLLQGAGVGWLTMGALRLSERKGKREKTLSAILVCFATIAVITAIGLLALIVLEDSSRSRWLMVIGAAFFLIQGWYETNLSLLRARLLVERYVVYTIVRTVVASIFGAWFAWIGWGAEGILVGGVLGVLVPSIILTAEIWLKEKIAAPETDDMRDMFRFGMPLALGFTVGAFILVTDRFLIEMFLGVYLLGIYGAAYQIADRIMRSVIEPLSSAGLPLAINKFEEEGAEAAREQLAHNWSLLIAVSLPAVLGLYAITPSLVEIMVGPDYREGALQVVPIIAFAAFFSSMRGGYLDHSFHLGQKTRLLLIQSIFVAILNIAVSVPLVLQMGIVGAAYGTLISQMFGVVLGYFFGRRVFVLPFLVIDTLKVSASAFTMLLCLQLIPFAPGLIALLSKTVLGATVYGLGLLVLNPFEIRPFVLKFIRMRTQNMYTG